MKVLRYSVEATIPTIQYGNIKPQLEFELDSEKEIDTAYEIAVNHIVKIHNDVGEKQLTRNEIKKQ